VIIYGASWCAFCHAAKEYLDKLGVKYSYKDIDSDIELAKEAQTNPANLLSLSSMLLER